MTLRLQHAPDLDTADKNSEEMEKVIDRIILKALSNKSYDENDKVSLFNKIVSLFNEDEEPIKKKNIK